jgi:hypothetical protein
LKFKTAPTKKKNPSNRSSNVIDELPIKGAKKNVEKTSCVKKSKVDKAINANFIGSRKFLSPIRRKYARMKAIVSAGAKKNNKKMFKSKASSLKKNKATANARAISPVKAKTISKVFLILKFTVLLPTKKAFSSMDI